MRCWLLLVLKFPFIFPSKNLHYSFAYVMLMLRYDEELSVKVYTLILTHLVIGGSRNLSSWSFFVPYIPTESDVYADAAQLLSSYKKMLFQLNYRTELILVAISSLI